ncbi:hypothetical protein CLIB1423_29S00870 [[Candida] railenensis]|uniref:Endonuclease/exonuclease/phosphatase domain-containing protein n=1 Tax=[Candida] railenensis TaxID=45579 RepID=A0A9P0QVW7_9ASCO|nr:hypothetical protein CLIB1423_29S00870 [[Candida] railenensis]
MNRVAKSKRIRVLIYLSILALVAFSIYNLWSTRRSNLKPLKQSSWEAIHSIDKNVDNKGKVQIQNEKSESSNQIEDTEFQKDNEKGSYSGKQKEKDQKPSKPLKSNAKSQGSPASTAHKDQKSESKADDSNKTLNNKLDNSLVPPPILDQDDEDDREGVRKLPVPAQKLPGYPQDIARPDRKKINPLRFRLYSHNVHESLEEFQLEGELPWAQRVHMVSSSINFNSKENTIVMLQEVKDFQLNDILKRLNQYEGAIQDEWEAYGAHSNGEKVKGTNVPILFRKSEWEVKYSYTHSLSEEEKSLKSSSYSKNIRVCLVTFMHIKTGNYINIFNTQLDAKSKESRVISIETIKALYGSLDHDWPTFIIGDLNFEYGAKPYKSLEKLFTNVNTLKSDLTNFGHSKSTLTGFDGDEIANGGTDIDYIWTSKSIKEFESEKECKPKDSLDFKLHGFALIHSKYMGEYMSDHRPLVGDFSIERCN